MFFFSWVAREGFNSVLPHDLGDGASSDTMIEVSECSLDARVSPGWVLLGHLKDQAPNFFHDAWSPDRLARIGPFLSDEPAMPDNDRIGRDDGGDRCQSFLTQGLVFGSQSASLIIGKESPLSTGFELLLENSVLFDQVGNRPRLLEADPASERGQKEL
jgi:hypothetical protein